MPADRWGPPKTDVLYEDAYVIVSVEDKGRVVRMTRTAQAFPTLTALEVCYGNVIQTYDQLGRRGRGLLVDVRAPTGRNEPEFERAMLALLPRLDRGYVRVGVLINSTVGRLQFRRWSSADDIDRLVSTNEAELILYVRDGVVPPGMKP